MDLHVVGGGQIDFGIGQRGDFEVALEETTRAVESNSSWALPINFTSMTLKKVIVRSPEW